MQPKIVHADDIYKIILINCIIKLIEIRYENTNYLVGLLIV
jgi:hypothetical protein